MKRLLSIMAIATLLASCSKEDCTPTKTYTLTGYSAIESRTEFGKPNDEWTQIPFLWSEGDKIWSNGEQSSEATINSDGSALFAFQNEPEATIYYNMTGSSATEAYVPATQNIAKNLGENGDFGYATVENGSFTLEHATAYLGFLPILLDDSDSNPENWDFMTNAKIVSITIDAADGIIAGKANWTGENFSTPTNGSSKITLSIGKVPDYDNLIYYPAVVLPADLTGKKIKFTYELLVDGKTKYYTEIKDGIELTAGTTYEIACEILSSALTDYRELRVLTFEDEDTKFDPHEIEISYFDWSIYDYVTETMYIEKWSDYIPSDSQYGEMHNKYSWYDKGNTELECTNIVSDDGMMGAGHAGISNYVGSDYINQGNYMYDIQAYNVDGGANGSANFCTQFGYVDPPQYEFENSPKGLPNLHFHDGVARVIDHMYVTNTTYAYNILVSGESGFGGNYEFTENSQFWVVAYGYDSEDDTDPTVVKFSLLDKGKKIVTDWTKWDLTGLGKVVNVEFNLEAGDNGYGGYGLVIPGYFAYDNVAVQF